MLIQMKAIGADAAGWLHQGMANRLAIDMGLNLDGAGSHNTSRGDITTTQSILGSVLPR